MDDAETIDLDADIVSLLEAERSPEPAPVEAKERVWERIQETLAVPPAATATSEATGLAGGGAATVIGVLVAGVVIAVAMSETPSQSRLNTPHPETSVHQLMEPAVAVPASPPPMVAPVVAPVVAALEQSPREPDGAVAPSPPPQPVPEARPAGTSRRASAPKGLSAAERALLDQGRSALREGRPGAALRAADEHQKRFPRGRLIEEGAALRIRALDRLGRHDASREAARVFLRRYPTSIHGIAIERILGSD
jgi:hypothetical protein